MNRNKLIIVIMLCKSMIMAQSGIYEQVLSCKDTSYYQVTRGSSINVRKVINAYKVVTVSGIEVIVFEYYPKYASIIINEKKFKK